MIYFNGDSWSTSYHVDDGIQSWPVTESNHKRWPNIVGETLNKPYVNDSLGGSSNSRILDCIENVFLQNQKPDLIILALTSHVRISVPSGFGGHWNLNPGGALDSVTGKFDNTMPKWYYKNAYNELDSIYRYYKNVYNMDRICKQIGSPYLIIQAWDDDLVEHGLFNNIEKIKNFVISYFDEYKDNDVRAINYINAFTKIAENMPKWHYCEETFSKLIGTERLDNTNHPDDIGHEMIADFILQKIQEYKI